MKIENGDTKQELENVILYLKKAEAEELRDSIGAILEDNFGGRHEHVSDEDFKKEISIVIED